MYSLGYLRFPFVDECCVFLVDIFIWSVWMVLLVSRENEISASFQPLKIHFLRKAINSYGTLLLVQHSRQKLEAVDLYFLISFCFVFMENEIARSRIQDKRHSGTSLQRIREFVELPSFAALSLPRHAGVSGVTYPST
jgi:hypothetical protein